MSDPIRLTQFSHGAGCGCKLSPSVLESILRGQKAFPHASLLVGNSSRDDAAVLDLGGGQGLISTTDFFMPVVDDPYTFGRIAAANAISDVYAMGGRPILAIGILGWPIDKLSPEVAGHVVRGARDICEEAGMPLAGGHSIDSPEPIFGLAVNGLVATDHIKRNDRAQPGDLLYLTKPLGIGILTTAEKRGALRTEDVGTAAHWMVQLNKIGAELGPLPWVHALTDVTGFGLLGHLQGMCAGSQVNAELWMDAIPTITDLDSYLDQGAIPGGTKRNLASYGKELGPMPERTLSILADPQTSGGLLIAIAPEARSDLESLLVERGLTRHAHPIGQCLSPEQAPRIRLGSRTP